MSAFAPLMKDQSGQMITVFYAPRTGLGADGNPEFGPQIEIRGARVEYGVSIGRGQGAESSNIGDRITTDRVGFDGFEAQGAIWLPDDDPDDNDQAHIIQNTGKSSAGGTTIHWAEL